MTLQCISVNNGGQDLKKNPSPLLNCIEIEGDTSEHFRCESQGLGHMYIIFSVPPRGMLELLHSSTCNCCFMVKKRETTVVYCEMFRVRVVPHLLKTQTVFTL